RVTEGPVELRIGDYDRIADLDACGTARVYGPVTLASGTYSMTARYTGALGFDDAVWTGTIEAVDTTPAQAWVDVPYPGVIETGSAFRVDVEVADTGSGARPDSIAWDGQPIDDGSVLSGDSLSPGVHRLEVR